MAIPHSAEESGPIKESLDSLLEVVREQRADASVEKITEAFNLAKIAHGDQLRKSGEPYLTHPLEVAHIVAELRMDDESVIAALLHDVLEDTEISAEVVEEKFGTEVLHLVEGVTKLKLNLPTEASDRQRAAAETNRAAESLRKMLLAMAADIRVMVIKLADRLHNMRTLDALPEDRRSKIANETLDIYAPLAARLGIWQVKWQLEDLAFKSLHPEEFKKISEMVQKSRDQREKELNEATHLLREALDTRGLKHGIIMGRPKHLYSIFNKVVKQGVPFEEIYDLTALRVIVDEQFECYLVLGITHELWLPMPNLFYDYIAMPKPNGYQSLHTKVIGPGGDPLEVQIRTRRMHEIAEFGVAAHWTYKEGGEKNDQSKLTNLRRQLFDWSSDSRTSSDFLRTVSTDLFSEQVFVFTPKGDVLDLPSGSTPIDFAFRVHTNIGLTTVGAKVNGIMVPLTATLQNGDVVELVTRSNAQPSLDWLEIAKSAHARSKIRTYFRKRNRGESEQRGKEAIEKELRSLGLDPRRYLGNERVDEIAKQIRDCETASDVFARVGEGLAGVRSVVDKLRGLVKETPEEGLSLQKSKSVEPTVITSGIDNVMLRRAKCCLPIPDEEVMGYVTRGRGIMIHRRVCPNALRLLENEPERMIPIKWQPDGNLYNIALRIVSVNRQGLLMDISTIFGESKTNVAAARIRTLPNNTAEIDVTIDVADTKHLRNVMGKIGNFSDVISILRIFGKASSK